MQEQLAKIQKDMNDQMLESQRSMMSELTQLLVGKLEKGKSPMVNAEDDSGILTYLPDFTPTNTPMPPQKVSVSIKPQYQTDTSAPINAPKTIVQILQSLTSMRSWK